MDTDAIEKAILGYMTSTKALDSPLLRAGLFESNKHRAIFKTIRDLQKNGEPVTMVTLSASLKRKVSMGYLVSLSDGLLLGITAERDFKYYVNKLIGINKAQEALKSVNKILQDPDPTTRLEEIKDILSSYELEDLEPFENSLISNQTDAFSEHASKKRRGEYWGHRIRSFPKLTDALMGLREIVVLSAQAKVGKSTFVLQVASDIAGLGVGILYYDFENGSFNLMARELCRKGNIKYQDLFSGDAILEKGASITGAIKRLQENYKNFAILTDRRLSIEKIKSHIAQMKKTTGQEDVLIIIDSLQKLPMRDLKERRAAIDTWLRGFEELKANDPDLTIMMVSELSREGQKPKESGDIEYTGHFLLRLESEQTEEEFRKTDNRKRNLWIEYARDVATCGPIKYEAAFEYWKFKESSDDW